MNWMEKRRRALMAVAAAPALVLDPVFANNDWATIIAACQRKQVPEVGFSTINLACTGANIVRLRNAAGLTVHDLQTVFGFNSPSDHLQVAERDCAADGRPSNRSCGAAATTLF